MLSSMMQRLPASEGLFCPTTLVITLVAGIPGAGRCGPFKCTEGIDSK
jgi:hypothetical protein